MKVCVVPADMAGCGHYRLTWAAEHLQMQGYDVSIQYPTDENAGLQVHFRGDAVNDPNAEIIDVEMEGDPDVIVMQRLSHNWHGDVLRILRAKGVAVVIDLDDDMSSIHPLNKAFYEFHPRNHRTPHSWRNVEGACKDATLVTVSTRSLLNVYAKHGRGQVIDNYVPGRYLGIGVEPDKVFGWPGTTDSHPDDLQVCGNAVQQLVDDGYEFRVVGPASQVQKNLRLKEQPPNTGYVSIANWTAEMARLQVCLAPLAPTQFNTSKSSLKLREASSVGVPWVASPRAEYRRFHKESGGGLLVDSSRDWYKSVKRLMDDEILRQDLGAAGREYMRTQTVELNAWRWMEAWERAWNIQNGRGS